MGITHLCFADDIMVFIDGSFRSIEGVVKIFNKFAEMLDLRISLDKTTLYLPGVTSSARQAIWDHFPFTHASLSARYLGMPLLTKRMTCTYYYLLLEKIQQRIGKW